MFQLLKFFGFFYCCFEGFSVLGCYHY